MPSDDQDAGAGESVQVRARQHAKPGRLGPTAGEREIR